MNEEQAKMLTFEDTGFPAEWYWQREGEPRRFYTRQAVLDAIRRRKRVAPAPIPKPTEPVKPINVRPTSATCKQCGKTFPVGPRGYVPMYCGRRCRDRYNDHKRRDRMREAVISAKQQVRQQRRETRA